MALPYISVEDCFPVIRQTILDAYKVDSFLMHYPYSDLERLDMGLRKMVWGTYSTNSAIFSLSPEQDAWQIIVLKSVLGFYNLIITVTNEEHPDMFAVPYRTCNSGCHQPHHEGERHSATVYIQHAAGLLQSSRRGNAESDHHTAASDHCIYPRVCSQSRRVYQLYL